MRGLGNHCWKYKVKTKDKCVPSSSKNQQPTKNYIICTCFLFVLLKKSCFHNRETVPRVTEQQLPISDFLSQPSIQMEDVE